MTVRGGRRGPREEGYNQIIEFGMGLNQECGLAGAGFPRIRTIVVGGGVLQEFAECERGLVLFSRLKETLAPVFLKEDVAEVLQQQVIISHVILEVFVMGEYMFDASRGGFTSGIMDRTETGKSDAIPIGNLALLEFKVRWELFFHLRN